MKKIIILHKTEGTTPLQALENFRKQNEAYQNVKMTYAGRLDPMASGLLLALVGDEVKNKEKYLILDKEYEFEILFGFATDTYDILGKVITPPRKDLCGMEELEESIKENLKHFTGKFSQKYPMYSSKTIVGKPLFQYARKGEAVNVPQKEIWVKILKFGRLKFVSAPKLLANIERRMAKVQGDFRQDEIVKLWRKHLSRCTTKYVVADFQIKCSSGTYVRGIANSLGEKLGIPALAFSIKRTKIGKWC